MSLFDDLFANSQERLFTVHGVTAIYDGTEITVCIQDYDVAQEEYSEVWVAAVTIDVRSVDVPEPKRGDTVMLEGERYQVGDIVNRDSLGATLALTKYMVKV